MGRKRQQSAIDDLFDLLKITPMWVGPVVAVLAFALFRFLVPIMIPPKQGALDAGLFLRQIMPVLAWIAGGAILLVWAMAEVHKLFNRRLLDNQPGLASIKHIAWREFEQLVSEAYRRKGYLAEVVGSESGDGGVDIRLTGSGETVLVQCKQWRAWKVGVTTARELLGVVISQRATRGIIVTSGRFTQEARDFARANPAIQLVDGPALSDLIRAVQASPTLQEPREDQSESRGAAPPTSSPRCPLCGTDMVLRTARKGTNAGSHFWGCPKYPGCRGTRPHASAFQNGERA